MEVAKSLRVYIGERYMHANYQVDATTIYMFIELEFFKSKYQVLLIFILDHIMAISYVSTVSFVQIS